MTSDTFRSHRVQPIDIVIHALQDALTGAAGLALNEHTTEECERLATLACALTRAINPGALASSWAADGDADIAGAHLARRLANPGGTHDDPRPTSNAEGRALETAVARRLADTACCLAITGDKEDAEHARALWQASVTLTGLLAPPHGLRHDPTLQEANAKGGLPETTAVDVASEIAYIDELERRAVERRAAKPTPRVLQSADEAPCGSLLQWCDDRLVLHFPDGQGWHLEGVAPSEDDVVWGWRFHGIKGRPVTIIAEGLTEPECRHLSGLSAADAIAWCEARDKASAPDADEPSPEAVTLELLRAALAVPGAEDIVAHARKLKAELTGERETNSRRMALLLQADERDDAVRAAIKERDYYREELHATVRQRDGARGVADALQRQVELAQSLADKAFTERDAAIEARAQMQARLVAVERERDAAQEEAKALRVAVANKMSESMLAIMEGIAKGPTMEWRNGKP